MKDLIKTTNNQSICENVHLCNELLKISDEQIICTLVYEFAKNLPFFYGYTTRRIYSF